MKITLSSIAITLLLLSGAVGPVAHGTSFQRTDLPSLGYLGLGEYNDALRWLEKSYEDRAGTEIGYIKVDPASIHCVAIRALRKSSPRSRRKTQGRDD
jgi:hypothetical protein